MNIPRVIHQTAPDFASLPDEISGNIAKTRELNPGWEYRFYSDEDVLRYIGRHFGEAVLRLCRRINPRYGVVLADLFRYMVVYREGGVYLDIKSSITGPLDQALAGDDAYLLSQWVNRLSESRGHWQNYPELLRVVGGEFQQWHVIARPEHPFLNRVIGEVLFNMENYHPKWHGRGKIGVLRVSGPICYTEAIAPMRARHPHRMVDIEELGFEYSIYDLYLEHMRSEDHYSRCREPIMLDP